MNENLIKKIEKELLHIAEHNKSIIEIDIVGSYARNMQKYYSDIDIIFVYSNVINKDFLFMSIGKMINEYKILIHPILIKSELLMQKNKYFNELLLNKKNIYTCSA